MVVVGVLENRGSIHKEMENVKMWTIRLAIYLVGFAASGLALAGYADFDSATGTFDLHPIDLYGAVGAIGGVVSSGLASLALWRGWGKK